MDETAVTGVLLTAVNVNGTTSQILCLPSKQRDFAIEIEVIRSDR